MKTKLKISLICVCIFSLLFCFPGCEFTHFDTNPTDVYTRHTNDDEVVDYHPASDETSSGEDQMYEDGAFDDYIDAMHGLKIIYLADAGEDYLSVSDANLRAQRQKFNQNAADQYYYMSWYVLTALVDRYGVSTGQQHQDYYFYTTSTTLDFSVVYNDSVETQLLKIEGRIPPVNPLDEPTFDTNARWTCSLATSSEANYYGTYIATFAPYVQLRFIEIALGLPETSLASVVSAGSVLTNVVNEKINNYAQKIQVLGINNLKTNDYINFVTGSVVGDWAYQSTVATIVQNFLTISQGFANYSRAEIADIPATSFYSIGEKTDPAKLGNISYEEYQSCTIFLKDGDPLAQNIYELYIDSKADIVVDVYLLLSKANSVQKVEWLCTFNTASEEDFYYSPTDSDEDVINNEPTNYNSIFLYEEITSEQIAADEFLNVYLNPESDNFGTVGTSESPISAQTTQKFLCFESDENIHSLTTPVSKAGQMVDLSDLQFYADFSKDCIVLLFDIQYVGGGTVLNHTPGDYAFKYLVTMEGSQKDEVLEDIEDDEEDLDDDDVDDDD